MKQQTFISALTPIVFLIGLLSLNVFLYGDNALGGANQLALLLAASLAAIIGTRKGFKWKDILNGVSKSISSTTPAIIILLLIGSLAGTWLISGIVPTMIYYGLQIISPKIFLVAACIICAIVSLASGSSWSTIATVGIALLGIGNALNISEGLVAGAIISGAYFGDKMSPLSDTTNLAPAMAGTDLFTHIRYMMYTTIPTFIITLIIFLIVGLSFENNQNIESVNNLLSAIENRFVISPWLFLVPVGVLVLIIKKVPALPALLAGTLLGGIFAIIFQPHLIVELSGVEDNFIKSSYITVINAMGGEISIQTSNAVIDDLLSTGGMYGMLNTIWLIICAMCFGGVMESTGKLKKISSSIIQYAENTGSVIATTACTCIFFNLTASDQYLSIVVPGRMYADTFKEKGLAPENLSRTLEDSGTVTSVLIPWNTCGATQSAILGVATLSYLPYCFFNIISPIMTVTYAYLGLKIKRLK
ncbi:Na+/H+ antiporter NhaC [bacterium]|nr:Na+/H+ antiporter NhaC [bacterium]MDB2675297.1 Na+/H+ antiporter NhaC [Flavobacteriales bacterium]